MTTEKTNRELVNDGFAFAKQISGLTPVNEIVKMIGDLATRLDVVSVRSNALAAENIALKHAMSVTLEHVSVTDAGQAGVAAMIMNDALYNTETPATDAAIHDIRWKARAEGIHFAANRMLAAWESGFVNDTPANAHDISGAVLSAVEFLPNADEGEFKRDYADEVRARIRAGEVSNG